jgi:hypothetical protein
MKAKPNWHGRSEVEAIKVQEGIRQKKLEKRGKRVKSYWLEVIGGAKKMPLHRQGPLSQRSATALRGRIGARCKTVRIKRQEKRRRLVAVLDRNSRCE